MGLRKFGRNYTLNIEVNPGGPTVSTDTLTVKPPFTVEFDITRNVMTSANVSSIRVYNLNKIHRSQIRKNINDYGDVRAIQFMAGYGNNLSTVFDGNITQAWSVREGTNFITQIESFDGGYAFTSATSEIPFPAGTAQADVIDQLIADLSPYGVSYGAVGSFPGSLSRGNTYQGQTTNLLQQLTGGRFFIDNGKAYVLADNECITGPITTISPASGLLNTPYREQTIILFDMLFEPKLRIGQQVTLDSITADANINGNYKVISLKHRGMISEAVCGEAITTVGLLQPLGSQGLVIVGGA